MTDNYRLPQNWPAHLAHDAHVDPVDTAPPSGHALLDFTSMNATTFEQFCWWLLKKDHTLVGCKRLGLSGTSQYGIDLLAFDAVTSRLQAFECKAWKKFTAGDITRAVDDFLKGEWAKTADSFTLILAQSEAGSKLLDRWEKERLRLKRVGIDFQLWTAHHLTLQVQHYPDILTKFFPFYSVETYANLWMKRVGFYELVSKSFFDPREKVAQWARELAGDEQLHSGEAKNRGEETGEWIGPEPFIDGTYRSITEYGNSWHFKGPWFHFSAMLPDEHFAHASAAITFNRPDMQGVVLTVDHTWLLTRFLFKTGAPLRSRCRDIIVGEVPNDAGLFVLDLPHCRLSLQEEGVRELIAVADHLTVAMREALQRLERTWSAQNFPFVMYSGKRVALAAVPKSLWCAMCQFAVAHDVSKGDTPWHMFDGNSQVLKPFHKVATEQFDAGYHGIFYAVDLDDLNYTDEVTLIWQPGGPHSGDRYSPRGWWSCEFAIAWLNDTLLPEVKRWECRRNFSTAWSRLFRSRQARAFLQYLNETFVMRDLRKRPLVEENRLSRSIVETTQALQSFFHGASAERTFIRLGDVTALYSAVAVAAKAGRGYVGYAQSKLGIDGNVVDHADLIVTIHQYVSDGSVHASSGVVDNALRALLELLSDSEAHLENVDQRSIADSLIRFGKLLDEAEFIRRHTKWI